MQGFASDKNINHFVAKKAFDGLENITQRHNLQSISLCFLYCQFLQLLYLDIDIYVRNYAAVVDILFMLFIIRKRDDIS